MGSTPTIGNHLDVVWGLIVNKELPAEEDQSS